MNETDDLGADDPLLALLDTFAESGSDIENRVMAQLAREDEQIALRADVAALRADVAALRSDISEIKRLLLARREPAMAATATIAADDSRGKQLLPYARNDRSPALLG